jgi:hypothetical protein
LYIVNNMTDKSIRQFIIDNYLKIFIIINILGIKIDNNILKLMTWVYVFIIIRLIFSKEINKEKYDDIKLQALLTGLTQLVVNNVLSFIQ